MRTTEAMDTHDARGEQGMAALGSHENREAEAITMRSSMRYQWFLRRELIEVPDWHPLHQEYRQQLQDLRRLGVRAWSDESP